MIRVYIETTIFNRFFDEKREYINETKKFFEAIKQGKIDAYTSVYVLEELERAASPKRDKMIALILEYEITVLAYNDKIFNLADLYIDLGIIPKKSRIDGVHIAMAAIHNMDCIVSLNFKHINKLKTKTATEVIHRMLEYTNPMICTPMEVIEDE